jgi:hypothetical protein
MAELPVARNCLAALRNFGATHHLQDQRYSEARSWYSFWATYLLEHSLSFNLSTPISPF